MLLFQCGTHNQLYALPLARHISHPRAYFHILIELNMILLFVALFFVLQVQCGAVACRGQIQLLIFACVALVVVVRFVVAHLVVGILVLIFRILEALFEGVLTLRSMDVTGLSLEGLIVPLRETLAIPVVAFVGTLVIPVVSIVGLLFVVCLTMRMAALVAAIVASVALIRKITNLVLIALHHLVAEFAVCVKLDLAYHASL